MATPVGTPIEYSERPLDKKVVAELKSIAAAMGLDTDLNKLPLLLSIQRHIKSHPEIADDPRFLPLFAHRSRPKTGKTSAEKSSEERVEATKPIMAVTGANKALLEHGVRTDPPAQFERLVSGGKKLDNKPAEPNVDDNSDDSSSESVPRSKAGTPEPEHKPEKAESKQEMPGAVQVNFFNENDHAAAPRQVLLDDFPVVVSMAHDGKRKYSTLLSELIPAAIKNDSPIKERGGRVYRPNIRGDPAHHHLGRLDAVLSGESTSLKPRQMNEYTLRPTIDGIFECDIFLDQSPQASGVAGADAPARATSDTDLHGAKAEPLKFRGVGSDIPLEIASDRAKHNPMHKNATPGLRDDFSKFIHARVKAAVPGIPDFGEEWTRCTFAGQMFDRYVMQDAVFKFLAGWSCTVGGYKVPQGHGTYSGVTFRKDFAYDALKIKSSTTNDIDHWFSPDTLEKAPKAKAWVESKGKTHDSRFRKMKSARFKEYLTTDHRHHRKSDKSGRRDSGSGGSRTRIRHRSSSSSVSAGPSRKHRKSVSSDEDEEWSGKGKGKAPDSNNLD
ncbi:hypothetical protein DFH09DRAFT_1371656 [Mycena vulgaris]|nr:hypothetical protein DFH09DRAFT_1371656 [Mycena vulgaris]